MQIWDLGALLQRMYCIIEGAQLTLIKHLLTVSHNVHAIDMRVSSSIGIRTANISSCAIRISETQRKKLVCKSFTSEYS